MVNKLEDNLDNPIDIAIYNNIDIFMEFYKKLGFTPNMLTTLALFFGILASYFLYNNYFILAALSWFISYYYDCFDGKFARKYKMISKFGDYYDHASDIIKTILLLYVLYLKIKPKYTKNKGIIIFIIIIFIILNILTFAHFGCQEKILKENKNQFESDTLKITENFIFTDCYEQMKISKYFSCGTNIIFIIIVILFIGTL
jgi:phosphatidylglycerophosphate synthase